MSWPIPNVSGGQAILAAWGNQVAAALNLIERQVGTITPTVAFGGNSVGVTYTSQLGRYRRIGDLVFVLVRVTLSNKGSSTGVASIGGLPFTVVTVNAPMNAGFYAALTGLTGAPMGLATGTVIDLRQTGAAGATTLNDTHFTNTSDLIVSGFYLTT